MSLMEENCWGTKLKMKKYRNKSKNTVLLFVHNMPKNYKYFFCLIKIIKCDLKNNLTSFRSEKCFNFDYSYEKMVFIFEKTGDSLGAVNVLTT